MHDRCARAEELVDALKTKPSERMQEHLASCESCRQELDWLREGFVMMAGAEQAAPPMVLRQIEAAVLAELPTPFLRRGGAGAGGPALRVWGHTRSVLGAGGPCVTFTSACGPVWADFPQRCGCFRATGACWSARACSRCLRYFRGWIKGSYCRCAGRCAP